MYGILNYNMTVALWHCGMLIHICIRSRLEPLEWLENRWLKTILNLPSFCNWIYDPSNFAKIKWIEMNESEGKEKYNKTFHLKSKSENLQGKMTIKWIQLHKDTTLQSGCMMKTTRVQMTEKSWRKGDTDRVWEKILIWKCTSFWHRTKSQFSSLCIRRPTKGEKKKSFTQKNYVCAVRVLVFRRNWIRSNDNGSHNLQSAHRHENATW